jgi:arabinose-5-phosphate isomerase
MYSAAEVRAQALMTIDVEARAIAGLSAYVDDAFLKAVHLIYYMKGRLVVSGIGKSAIIAQKLVATFNSTGTPALFMHAADAIHGDLGMILSDDVVLIISKSGDSPEIKVLVPIIKSFSNPVIAICGNEEGYLARHADCFINSSVDKEACPHNLAPTTSTTAQMVMGDALAVCLLQIKGFMPKDFARNHPGGALGKRLYLRVGEVINRDAAPRVNPSQSVREVMLEISDKRLGATAVVDDAGVMLGIITDGDIRRAWEHHEEGTSLVAAQIFTANPKCIEAEELAATAVDLMREYDITQLIVLQDGNYLGILHLHDLLREGIL